MFWRCIFLAQIALLSVFVSAQGNLDESDSFEGRRTYHRALYHRKQASVIAVASPNRHLFTSLYSSPRTKAFLAAAAHSARRDAISSSEEEVYTGCYDRRLTEIINTALRNYFHDMGQLSSYVLNQVIRSRMDGSWFVHAQQIQASRPGVEWESKTNGDIFSPSSTNGCYFHDTQTYIVVLRY